MARRIGQMVGPGRPTSWLVRVCSGRDPEAKKREYLNQTIRGRTAGRSNSSQRMLGEREIAAGISTPRDEPYYELYTFAPMYFGLATSISCGALE